jgi:tetratricopeptide (TPR) repeat protein
VDAIPRFTKTAGVDWGGAFFIIAIVAISMGVYLNTLEGSFVYDDNVYVVNNPYIKGEHNVAAALTSPYYAGTARPTLYRPLTTISYIFDRSVWGMNPLGFHLTNIMLHALCSAIFYLLLLSLLKDRLAALVGGLLFAIHPVHTEAVAWITGRAEILAGAFFLLAFLLYLKARTSSRLSAAYIGSVVFYMLAVLSKETAASLPLVLIIYEALAPRPSEGVSMKSRVFRLLPYFAAATLYASIRIKILGAFGIPEEQQYLYGVAAYPALLHVIKSFGYYLRLFFYPNPLNAQYHIPFSHSLLVLPVLLSILALTICAVVVILFRRRHPIPSFGILFFFVSLLPVANIIPIGESVAERFLYIPSMALSICAAYIFSAGHNVNRPGAKAATIAVVVALFTAMSVLTIGRNRVWMSDLSLFTDTVAKNPLDPKPRYSLGNALIKAGRPEEAVPEYRMSIKLSEGNWRRGVEHFKAYNNLGVAYMRMGRLDDAVAQFEKALSLNPGYTMARENLRLVLKLLKSKEHEK